MRIVLSIQKMNGLLFEKVHQIKLFVKDFWEKDTFDTFDVILTLSLSLVKYLATWDLYYIQIC